MSWDYINIGSNGFAQVGQEFFAEKCKIEMDHLEEMLDNLHPVPKEFNGFAHIRSMRFDHEFGTYKEIVVSYDRDFIDELAESDDEEKVERSDRFWNWVNTLESVELETPEISEALQLKWEEYMREHNITLTVVHKMAPDSKERKLKRVA